MALDPAEVVRHHEFRPEDVDYVRPPVVGHVAVVPYDATWPALFVETETRVRAALGDRVVALEHVGSTAVPGLAAKPVIDVDLTVADSADESAYVPALERTGFELVLREPSWHEHRVLRGVTSRDDVTINLHVWGPACPEVERHRLLRDWLRSHPDECDRYARAKEAASGEVNRRGGGLVMDYNQRKERVVREILDRCFRAHGLQD